MSERLHILIFGGVQGVFFRTGAQSEAKRLGITGWVHNLPDGSVEVMAEGGREPLESLLEWCGHGPAGAAVSEIKSEWLAASGKFNDFRVKY
jgi:acylphosphatase